MARVAILPDGVADQIAAGEVVERPASVVKELIENALDAGATDVRIRIEGSGRGLIEVTDNGDGMSREDAVMALDRHATSKLRSAAELVGVATYGFRGEALPSIASIAKVHIDTSEENGEGTRLRIEGGRLQDVATCARQRGTTVTVQRLFFNVPARRKFLRSRPAETRAVVQAVTVLALAHPEIGFTLDSDDKTLLNAPATDDPLQRLEDALGRDITAGMIAIQGKVGPVEVAGFIQRPADARPAGRKTFLTVNGRPFKDPFVVRAAEAGYRATIHPGGRPTVVLSLAVPKDGVDVNVHPAKTEVRFRDKRLVEHAVEQVVREALGGLDAAAVVNIAPVYDSPVGPEPAPLPLGSATHAVPPSPSALDALFSPELPSETERTLQPPSTQSSVVPDNLLQVFRTYLVYETPDGLAIIDQHSAHERVLYERVMKEMESGVVSAQRLLLPVTVELDPDELNVVTEHTEWLARIGYEVEEFGGRSVILHAVPNPHPRFDARRCFEEIVTDFARGRFGGWTNRMERFAATYACRAAVKAGQVLDHQEQRQLLVSLFACELPPHDVHGRPTIVQLPKQDLDRRFGR